MYKEITHCRICNNPELSSVLDLGSMALTGVFPHKQEITVPTAPLHLVKCHSDDPQSDHICGLVQLKHSYDPEKMYRSDYGYRSGLNKSMVKHLQGKVENIQQRLQLKASDLIIDIGSNDGTLLKAYPDKQLKRLGIDPTGEKFRKYYPKDIELAPEFFSADIVKHRHGVQKARVITSISMFYDLDAPLAFMQQISELLSDDGIWVFEQSYLPTMLQMNSYDTVCHEHLEFYALRQIKWMIDRVGLKIIDIEFNAINGGSFSITAAHLDSPYPAADELVEATLRKESKQGLNELVCFQQFEQRTRKHASELKNYLQSLQQQGKRVLGYGASTKGNVILQHCRISPLELPAIAEINEDKFGARTPGTDIPIISEQQARELKPDFFLVLPWHFKDAIVQREQRFLEQGGGLLFPLPRIEVITA